MVFHSRLDFRSLRRHRSRDQVKTPLDSPTLPKPPAIELPQSLIDAMENMPLRHSRSMDVHPPREDVVSGFFNLQPQLPPANTTRLESVVERLFSEEHFSHILSDKALFQRFSAFLNKYQPQYVPALIRYLDMLKAAKAIEYANAITRRMVWTDRLESHRLSELAAATMDPRLKSSMAQDLHSLRTDVLPAFITQTLVSTVADCVTRDITGNAVPAISDLLGGLAEVFCLTDPSIKDNPIIYASEEFYHTTQYGMGYAINRNCRFLQGPETDKTAVARLGQAIREGREISETILNYRRDGSPFVNLLMMAPLMDDVGKVKYYIGCQVDVTKLVEEGRGIESFRSLLHSSPDIPKDVPRHNFSLTGDASPSTPLRALQELSQMFSHDEAEAVKKGVRDLELSSNSMVDSKFSQSREDLSPPSTGSLNNFGQSKRSRRIIGAELSDHDPGMPHISSQLTTNGSTKSPIYANIPTLPSVYKHYLLVRPYPSLQIVFLSPTLRIPGLLRSNLFNKITGPEYTISSLESAFKDGASVTAKILWLPKPGSNMEGRPRWIRCSPLIGSNGQIGVWMIILVPIETQNQELLDPPSPPPTERTREERSTSRQSKRSIPSSVRSRSIDEYERNHQNGRDIPIRTASAVSMRKSQGAQGIAVKVPSGYGVHGITSPLSPALTDHTVDLYADFMRHPERGPLPMLPASPPSLHSFRDRSRDRDRNRDSRATHYTAHTSNSQR